MGVVDDLDVADLLDGEVAGRAGRVGILQVLDVGLDRLGIERRAVGERDVIAQCDRPRQAVVRGFARFREPRHDLAIGVAPEQRLEVLRGDQALRIVAADVRVEARRFGVARGVHQGAAWFRLRAAVSGGLGCRASREEERGRGEGENGQGAAERTHGSPSGLRMWMLSRNWTNVQNTPKRPGQTRRARCRRCAAGAPGSGGLSRASSAPRAGPLGTTSARAVRPARRGSRCPPPSS